MRLAAGTGAFLGIFVLLCSAACTAAEGCSEGGGDGAACPARGRLLLQARVQSREKHGQGALNETALAQALEAGLDGLSKEALSGIGRCIILTCMNFLDGQREENCGACVQEAVDAFHAGEVGVNGLARGYVRDGLTLLLDKSTDNYARQFCGGDLRRCTEKEDFMGDGMTSIMGWDRVAEVLRATPAKQWSGEWWRGNELGFIINNPFFWASMDIDPIGIVLGSLPKQHAVLRPIFEELWTLDSPGRRSEVQALVTEAIRGFLRNRRETGMTVLRDVTALVHQILYQVTFGRTISFEDAEEFVEVQSEVVALATLSHLLPAALYRFIEPVRERAAAYAREYSRLLEARFGARLAREDCSPSASCMAQLGSAVWDSLYGAGGLSVPSSIGTGIAVLFSTHGSNPFRRGSFSRDQALSFYWENIRFFPPVVGFPHWEKRPTCAGLTEAQTAALSKPDGRTEACPLGARDASTNFPRVNQYQGGKRVTPVLALAQKDPKKWGNDAHRFVLRGLREYETKSLGFAEGAVDQSVAAGGMDRVCPGKDLALMIGATFFELFDKSDWAQPRLPIEFTGGPSYISTFTLSSKRMVRSCNEVCPDCSASCPLVRATCESDKAHCWVCKRCRTHPPRWWDVIGRAACSTC